MTKDEALKLALEAFEWNFNTDLDNIPACERWAKMLKENITALNQAIAEAEQQEPVARLRILTDSLDMGQSLAPSRTYKTATATTYKAAMELPLGYYDLYTSPPHRKPLTNEEIEFIYADTGYNDIQMFARAIEAAHGIKE